MPPDGSSWFPGESFGAYQIDIGLGQGHVQFLEPLVMLYPPADLGDLVALHKESGAPAFYTKAQLVIGAMAEGLSGILAFTSRRSADIPLFAEAPG